MPSAAGDCYTKNLQCSPTQKTRQVEEENQISDSIT